MGLALEHGRLKMKNQSEEAKANVWSQIPDQSGKSFQEPLPLEAVRLKRIGQ